MCIDIGGLKILLDMFDRFFLFCVYFDGFILLFKLLNYEFKIYRVFDKINVNNLKFY